MLWKKLELMSFFKFFRLYALPAKNATREILFHNLWAKATSLVEVGIPSPYCIHFNEIINDELRMYEPLKKGKGCLLDEARYVPTKNDPLL